MQPCKSQRCTPLPLLRWFWYVARCFFYRVRLLRPSRGSPTRRRRAQHRRQQSFATASRRCWSRRCAVSTVSHSTANWDRLRSRHGRQEPFKIECYSELVNSTGCRAVRHARSSTYTAKGCTASHSKGGNSGNQRGRDDLAAGHRLGVAADAVVAGTVDEVVSASAREPAWRRSRCARSAAYQTL